LIFGNAAGTAISAVPRIPGAASAVLGGLQFGTGAIVSPLIGIGGSTTALPMAIAMLTLGLVSVGASTSALRRSGKAAAVDTATA
jgi:DHA1 family bicyclomycin/chloramphenicol resistance-like MFS transporter